MGHNHDQQRNLGYLKQHTGNIQATNTSPRGTLGSNHSTESSINNIRKATDNMQMLCKGSRLQPKARSQRISTTAQQQDLIKGKIVSGHETTQGRCLRAPHQLQANVRKQYPNEASQQEESNATTLTSIGADYRRQSKKIRKEKQFRNKVIPLVMVQWMQ
ncbi:pentatricopeptide repeat-containing protein [Dorcoceras hygrometricum]|uniref:Pentatricopeptide repeat-containing protein n=1 Tax=Dorcoceras hygrometricum TaxID=472368 RepID=A0A2Z7AQL2_9LAMI|nr:pentatricopeptide repeat-containing protein [Dorcoceras hygrometricum]